MTRFARAFALPLFLGFAAMAQLPAPLLKVGPTRHYLIDENGKPFQLRGEAAWALAVQLTREDVFAYLDDRQAKGFNALLIEAVNVNDGYAANAPKNAYGESQFALVTTDKGAGKGMSAAARADDGSFAVVYTPDGGAFGADLSKLAGKAVKASWIDPYSGATHVAAGSPFAKSAHAFDPAGENGKNADPATADDWVLLLESDASTGVRDARIAPPSHPASGFQAADACGRSPLVSRRSAAGAYPTFRILGRF